jgi:hypothetical protein
MTQGLNQINQQLQGTLASNRCRRTTRPPSPRPPYFPAYLNEHFTVKPYAFTDSNGNNLQGLMGDRMEVTLLPGAYLSPGNTPGPNELEPITKFLQTNYQNHNFIKGHMWNEEIGGKGVTQNLVPLTSQANSAHKNNVETPLKEALRNFENFYLRNKPSHPDYEQVYGFRYVVEIEDAAWPTVTENIVPNSIHAQLFPIKYARNGNISPDNSIINNAIPSPGIRDRIDRLLQGIWIDQNGVVT